MTRKYLQRPNPEGYLTVKEMAEITGFSTGTIYGWFRQELLPFIRGIKAEYLVRRRDLRKFLRKYYGVDLYEDELEE
jgi:excisionase family DNA binding protein